jgi:hypothetical protein
MRRPPAFFTGRLDLFNAIKYYRELEAAGFTREQAEAALNMVHQFAEHNLATKQDVLELKHAIASLEQRLTIKMGTMAALIVGLIVGIQRIL